MIMKNTISPCSLSGEMLEPLKLAPRMPSKVKMRKLKGSWNSVEDRTSFSLAQLNNNNNKQNHSMSFILFLILWALKAHAIKWKHCKRHKKFHNLFHNTKWKSFVTYFCIPLYVTKCGMWYVICLIYLFFILSF